MIPQEIYDKMFDDMVFYGICGTKTSIIDGVIKVEYVSALEIIDKRLINNNEYTIITS